MGISEKAVPKSTLSQHFNVLREAGLIHSERRGVQMQNSSRCAEIERRFPDCCRPSSLRHAAQQKTPCGRPTRQAQPAASVDVVRHCASTSRVLPGRRERQLPARIWALYHHGISHKSAIRQGDGWPRALSRVPNRLLR